MELYASDVHYILVDGEHSLWFDRLNAACEAKTLQSGYKFDNAECMGTVYGYVGKISVSHTSDTRLVFIRTRGLVGNLKNATIYKITSILTIPLEGDVEIFLEPSKQALSSQSENPAASQSDSPSHQSPVEGSRSLIKTKVPPIRGLVNKKIESKVDRRMLDEFNKMFTEAESFYYSPNSDITNSLQRRQNRKDSGKEVESESLWELADKRFVWNSYMMESLINSQDKKLERWIIPIIQGFIEYESCTLHHAIDPIGPPDAQPIPACIDIWLISRRSRFQAGTRYLRRGVDEHGKVANYVETEQVISYKGHAFSFVQVRGSIPVFWSQSTRYRYRPPPKIERDDAETFKAFTNHFEEELSIYGQATIVNLVEKHGKEKVLGDAFIKNVLQLNSKDLTYVNFDFHDQCRGMNFNNVSILTQALEEHLRGMGYCWVDAYGVVMKQEGVFRVNCVDCLDRTNVVQTHLAKEMLIYELSKVGLIAPEIGLPSQAKKILQVLWANNGDTLSKQYAGTNALKGDFTRTGERKFAGMMKDGMNSANRYYLNKFRDTSRQATIDLMLGVRKYVTEEDLNDDKNMFEKETSTDQIKAVIEDVKRCIIPPEEVILGAWGLVNGKINELDSIDVDCILVLTESNYYVTEYDCSSDSMTDVQKVSLTCIDSLQLGFEILKNSTTSWNIFSGNNMSQTLVPYLKINFHQDAQINDHEFRSSNMRFFNNVAVPIQQPEEMHEGLRMIAESIKIAVAAQGKEDIEILIASTNSTSSNNKPRIPGSNWMNRYFNPAQQLDSSIAKKISVASFDKLKNFRRGSKTGEGSTSLQLSQKPDGVPVQSTLLHPNQLQLGGVGKNVPNLINFQAMTPDPSKPPCFPLVNDLVLSSCGILSPGRMFMRPNYVLMEEDNAIDIGISPMITPVSDITTPSEQQSAMLMYPRLSVPMADALQRHRYSLPANSLGIQLPLDTPKRSRTPEIKITEEASITDPKNLVPQKMSEQSLSVTTKRISRSSEDVNKGRGFFGGISAQAGFKLQSIFPITKNDNRSSSQQNIFNSAILKGSHSDNALKENPQQSQKVLGKLAKGMQSLGANYLDPRKFRESFKPVVKQDSIEDKELDEKKRQSFTKFIDV